MAGKTVTVQCVDSDGNHTETEIEISDHPTVEKRLQITVRRPNESDSVWSCLRTSAAKAVPRLRSNDDFWDNKFLSEKRRGLWIEKAGCPPSGSCLLNLPELDQYDSNLTVLVMNEELADAFAQFES